MKTCLVPKNEIFQAFQPQRLYWTIKIEKMIAKEGNVDIMIAPNDFLRLNFWVLN